MRLLGVLAFLLMAAACGSSSSAPDVDWSRVPANQRTSIEDAVQAGDCARMQTYFDGSKNADVLTYLDWQMKHASCN